MSLSGTEKSWDLPSLCCTWNFHVFSLLVACCCCCWVTSVVSDSARPHRRQPTRLPHPWVSPGKNTGVGCHFLLQWMKVKSESCSVVSNSATPRTAAYQAPPSVGFSRQEYWSGLPLPSPLGGLGRHISPKQKAYLWTAVNQESFRILWIISSGFIVIFKVPRKIIDILDDSRLSFYMLG